MTPVVSVICETYNHESYIRTCLDSLLAQEVTFPYEIIVHDDASTDATPEIVAEYARRFPDIVRPILQTENQLSKGRNPFDIAGNIASGTYIACCEGDDFWIDKSKLASQVAYLDAHPECTFCFTNARFFDDREARFSGTLLPGSAREKHILSEDRKINSVDMLHLEFIPTASFIFPRWAYEQRPIFPRPAFEGDRYLQMVMTEAGQAHYMDIKSSAYRINNANSMMEVWRRNNHQMYKSDVALLALFRSFDDFTHGKYREDIDPWIMRWDYAAAHHSGNAHRIRQRRFWEYARGKGLKETLVYMLTCVSPRSFLTIRRLVRAVPSPSELRAKWSRS